MANLNKVLLMGRLTRDPELRYLPSGSSVAEFGLAVNRNYTDKNGAKQEETCFIDVKAWGRQAEVLSQYLSKGRQVFIEGRLSLDQWETNDGQKRSKLRVVVEGFQFIDSGQARSAEAEAGNAPESYSGQPQGGGAPAYGRPAAPSGGPPPAPAPDDDLNLDDIPF